MTVCRCFGGARRSSSSHSSIVFLNCSSRGEDRTGVFHGRGTGETSASRTNRRAPGTYGRAPEPTAPRATNPAGSARTVLPWTTPPGIAPSRWPTATVPPHSAEWGGTKPEQPPNAPVGPCGRGRLRPENGASSKRQSQPVAFVAAYDPARGQVQVREPGQAESGQHAVHRSRVQAPQARDAGWSPAAQDADLDDPAFGAGRGSAGLAGSGWPSAGPWSARPGNAPRHV